MKTKSHFNNIPKEVLKVWTIQLHGYCGLELYKECQAIIDKYPQYFQIEHKYKTVPKEVHEAYQTELKESYSKKEESEPYQYSRELTEKDLRHIILELIEMEDRRQKEEAENEKIWNKHYLKYGITYKYANWNLKKLPRFNYR